MSIFEIILISIIGVLVLALLVFIYKLTSTIKTADKLADNLNTLVELNGTNITSIIGNVNYISTSMTRKIDFLIEDLIKKQSKLDSLVDEVGRLSVHVKHANDTLENTLPDTLEAASSILNSVSSTILKLKKIRKSASRFTLGGKDE